MTEQKPKIDVSGIVLVGILLTAGVSALALKESNLGTTLIGLAIGLVVPSPLKAAGVTRGIGTGASTLLLSLLVVSQGCAPPDAVPSGVSLVLGVCVAFVVTSHVTRDAIARMIAPIAASVILAFGIGCGYQTTAAYSAIAADCIAREQVIVDRPDSSIEQDEADLRAVRNDCDERLSAIEGGAR